ncbi:uncharacterized protein LOC134692385 [Mytilus trossulus]|uniref:uncharacterized protein LOC134692385 n=1 Tax=Mytilus trossulus TaxID=6551 RepID=UPI00300569A4
MDTKPRIYKEKFKVPLDLMGIAIGTEGANINKSRHIKGVLSVNTNKTKRGGNSFTVVGESPEAVKKARSVLELRQQVYTIPKRLAGKLIGKSGQAIEEVINRSLVNRITKHKENGDVVLNIIGPPEAIENAKLLLNYKLDQINRNKPFRTETFMVPLNLIGRTIGTRGANIKKAQQISGVFSVDKEKQPGGECRFRIFGETLEAVKKARSMLELSQHAYRVPKHYIAGPVIGKFEQAIEEVINETIIKTITKHNKNNDVILTIIGPTEAIDYAKCLLKYKLDKTEGVTFKRKDEYSTEETERYEAAASDEYSSEENDGYSILEKDGYNVDESDGYSTVEKEGYRTEEKYAYNTIEDEVYSTSETERYHTVEMEEYMTEEIGEYRTTVKDGYMTEEKDEYNTEDNARYISKEADGCSTAETDANSTVEKETDLVMKDKTRDKEDTDRERWFIEKQMPRSHEGQNPLCAGSDTRSKQPTYNDLPMHIANSAVQSDPSFGVHAQCEIKNICSKKKKRKTKVKNKFVKTDHGQTKLTNAKIQDNYLGKYTEAAIQVKGINAGLKADNRPACDDDKGTCLSLDSPNILYEKDEIIFERCNRNEISRIDQEQLSESQITKDAWDMWDSDEEPSISTELEQFKIDETNTSYCLCYSQTNQLLSVNGEAETSVGGWW